MNQRWVSEDERDEGGPAEESGRLPFRETVSLFEEDVGIQKR